GTNSPALRDRHASRHVLAPPQHWHGPASALSLRLPPTPDRMMARKTTTASKASLADQTATLEEMFDASRKTDARVISVRGAREHNLKSVDHAIPRDKLVVFTGLSGSGKSSLAFDTIYAEGQRRYVESLSAYARQFLEMMQKPDVDQID